MKAVLLSIKPEFAHKIFEGSKKFEFRKQVFKDTSVKKVIGEFEIETILDDTPDKIWIQTRLYSGISRKFFKSYFEGRDKAYAIKVASTKRYLKQKSLADFNIHTAPQSFAYVNV